MRDLLTDFASALRIGEEQQEEKVEGEPGNEDPGTDDKEDSNTKA